MRKNPNRFWKNLKLKKGDKIKNPLTHQVFIVTHVGKNVLNVREVQA